MCVGSSVVSNFSNFIMQLNASGSRNAIFGQWAFAYEDFIIGQPLDLHMQPKATLNVVDYSDPFAIHDLLESLDTANFRSKAQEIEIGKEAEQRGFKPDEWAGLSSGT
ncbi:hypothetical protein PVL29_008596 [Vitis rotundifolia]|uniref:Uncharacterized protein n=1 Tax=Vitis rotundifolia TaxID=103349 RepID=A0AA39DUX0_VITRO|nr:hypothetical protein PVL29_008596 [Vitis rotundifolia]